jgi:hypothetical protein
MLTIVVRGKKEKKKALAKRKRKGAAPTCFPAVSQGE